MKKIIVIGFGVWLAAGTACAQQKLSLEDYLGQVKSLGSDYQASQAMVEGMEKQSHQMDLVYSPALVASYNHLTDQEQQPTVLSNNQTLADTAGVSLVDKLPFGPTVGIGYSFNDLNLTYSPVLLGMLGGTNASAYFLSSYYQVSPVVFLSLPLFKDFGGAQTNAGVKKVQFQFESAAKGSAFQREGVLFQAKTAYWNLALARQVAEIRRDTLDRSQKIWDWTKNRVSRDLADPPDALQAEASVRMAQLDLRSAQDGERSARLAFNSLRDKDGDGVPEALDALEDSLALVNPGLPSRAPERLDLQAVEAQTLGKKAAYDETYQNIYPDVTAYASWRGNGLDPDLHAANDIAFGTDHPTWMAGAQFTLPLDLFTASRTAEGYQKEYESAELGLKHKKLEVSQAWLDLQDRLADVEDRLAMAADIESLQKRNAEEEKRELTLGRATQFQLLSFENQYSLARLGRLSLVAEKLILLAQAQWYMAGGAPDPAAPREGGAK